MFCCENNNGVELDNMNILFSNIFCCSVYIDTEQKRYSQYEKLKTFENYNIGERK